MNRGDDVLEVLENGDKCRDIDRAQGGCGARRCGNNALSRLKYLVNDVCKVEVDACDELHLSVRVTGAVLDGSGWKGIVSQLEVKYGADDLLMSPRSPVTDA